MLDYHLHLWPHSEHETPLRIEQLAAYCARAQEAGVTELALTEHLFRFRQADTLLGGFWDDERVPATLAESMARYWKLHATADLDAYVRCAQEAKAAGLPVVIGLEVDYYEGRMDEVADLLAEYPFDVLLGSVHWVGSRRWASEAVVSGTPRSTKRSRSPADGYCSPTGLRQPAEDTSAAIPEAAAASARRSHHSPGASGTCPATLIRSGWASTSHERDAASSSMASV